MSTKAQVKTPAKAPAAPVVARIPQPPVAVPEYEAERPDIAAQPEGAARLGHSLGAVNVDRPAPPLIQRQEIPEEEEEEEEELQLKREPAAVQRQEQPEEEEELMLKSDIQRVGAEGGPVAPEVEAAINRARGGGQPLEGTVQAQMSEAMGHDFSRVRVHTDAEADELNQQLSARAFTTGPDIFFKRGVYEPGSSSGQELIAHELTHVVQQSTRVVRGGGSGVTVRPAGDAFEQAADEQARQVALQRAVANRAMAPPADIFALQRRYGIRAVMRLPGLRPRDKELLRVVQRDPGVCKEHGQYEGELCDKCLDRGWVIDESLKECYLYSGINAILEVEGGKEDNNKLQAIAKKVRAQPRGGGAPGKIFMEYYGASRQYDVNKRDKWVKVIKLAVRIKAPVSVGINWSNPKTGVRGNHWLSMTEYKDDKAALIVRDPTDPTPRFSIHCRGEWERKNCYVFGIEKQAVDFKVSAISVGFETAKFGSFPP